MHPNYRRGRLSVKDRRTGRLLIYLREDDLTEERLDEMETTPGWVGFFDDEDGRGPYVLYDLTAVGLDEIVVEPDSKLSPAFLISNCFGRSESR